MRRYNSKTLNKRIKRKRNITRRKIGGNLREYYHYSDVLVDKSNLKNISNGFLKMNIKFNNENNNNNNNNNNDDEIFREMIYGMKPGGLWLSKDTEWANFTNINNNSTYLYKVTIDDSNMLILDSIDKVEKFTKEYKIPNGIKIDWEKVAREYDGVIFDNYHNIKKILLKRLNSQYMWFLSVDINSACTWRPNKTVKEWELAENE